MRFPKASMLALTLGLSACGGPPSETNQTAASTARDGEAGASDNPSTDATMNPSPDARPEGAYRLLGVVDPDMDSLVAFAMKIPRDWQSRQQFTRLWVTAVPQDQIYLSFTAPDGRSQIEYLPSRSYTHLEGPLIEQNEAMTRSMGMPSSRPPNDLPPMPPVPYIRQVLLPQLAQQGFRLSGVGNEQEAPKTRDEYQRIVSRGSVDGTLPNGNKARVECRIFLNTQEQQGNMIYSWSVVPSITQTSGDLAAVHAQTVVAQESIVANPTWLERIRAIQARGQQVNSDIIRRNHEATMGQIESNTAAMNQRHQQRMGEIRRQGEANMAQMDRNQAATNEHFESMDRRQEMTSDGILGREKLVDPTTGERVKVDVGYNHIYRDRQDPNQYYGTDTPINPQRVDWQELQRVSAEDY